MATFNAVSPRVLCLVPLHFTFEPFPGGLARQDADEDTQAVVAATRGHASWCSVSSLAPITLPSRSHDNAAAPLGEIDLCVRTELIVAAIM
jgi:hypothetical protein